MLHYPTNMKHIAEYLPILKINVKNLNGRTYSQQNVDDIISRFNEKFTSQGIFFGELGHPENGDMDVNLRNVTHSTRELKQEGDVLYGRIVLLETDKARDSAVLEMLPNLVLRPRGVANVSETGQIENYRICAFDLIQKETDAFAGLI